MLGVVGLDGTGLGPEIGGKVLVGSHESDEGSLQEVLSGSGMTGGLCVTILNTSEGEHLLGDGSTDNTGTSGSGHELDENGSAFTGDLAWNGMDVTDLVTPITSTDGDKTELGVDESTLDGDLDFLGDLDAETDMASHIADGDNSLKAGSLSGLGLLLDGDDLHDIVLELVLGTFDEGIDDLALLDGDGVSVDLFEGADLLGHNETSKLGLGEPFILGGTTTATWTVTTTTAATASAEASAALATAITTAVSATASAFSYWCWCCCNFCHCDIGLCTSIK